MRTETKTNTLKIPFSFLPSFFPDRLDSQGIPYPDRKFSQDLNTYYVFFFSVISWHFQISAYEDN